LTENGANVNDKDNNGNWTPLHVACQDDRSAENMRLLVSKGADVNAKDKDGWAPLHFCSTFSGTITVNFLIGNGADVNAKNDDGWTPLHCASHNKGKIDAAFVLLGHGADMSIKSNDGKTALDVSTSKDVTNVLYPLTQLSQENRRALAMAMAALRSETKLEVTSLSEKQQKLAVDNEQHTSELAALRQKHKNDIAAIQDMLAKSLADADNVKAEQSEQIAALQDEVKSGKSDNVAIHNKLKKMYQENKHLKATVTKQFADTERTNADSELTRTKAKQAEHDMRFNLIMKRKQLQDAGISDSVIDDQLPLPEKDEDEPPAKKQRHVVCKKEEE
jgi:ankyrin repeat protein